MQNNIKNILKDDEVSSTLRKLGYKGTPSMMDIHEGVYAQKGIQTVLSFTNGKVLFKQQPMCFVEAENLQRKLKDFPDRYPKVYIAKEDYIFMEFIDGENSLSEIRKGIFPDLNDIITHIAEVHNRTAHYLRTGEITFKPKDYTEYCMGKFQKHLPELKVDVAGIKSDLQTISEKLRCYPQVEHIDANLANWIGNKKIDETNNTLSVPALTLKSLLEYGPIHLEKKELDDYHVIYCRLTLKDYSQFTEETQLADPIFHLNKIFRNIRYLDVLRNGEFAAENSKDLSRHIQKTDSGLKNLNKSGFETSNLQGFLYILTKHAVDRGHL